MCLACQPAMAAPPTCTGAAIAQTADDAYFIGSSGFASTSGEAEAGSYFRWLTNGVAVTSGQVAEDLLLHFDNSALGANGEIPASAVNLAYAGGKWGGSLALSAPGGLKFACTNNLHWDQGTIEFWVAARADGTNASYAAQDHILFYYSAPNGDYLQIAQSKSSHILYVGGTVGGQWESAYGSHGDMSAWKAGEWHHLAFTYSAAESFMRFYVDGVLAAANNEGHYYPPASTGNVFAVGGNLSGSLASYWLDELRISRRVADAAEITARAKRLTAAQPNEVWLPAAKVTPGTSLVFEFTPATLTQTGAVCQSSVLLWSGIPITNAQPPSTLLPPGAASVALTVGTALNTSCAFAVGQPLPFAQMTAFAAGAGSTQHQTTITGLNPDPNVMNDVYVRCAAQPDYLLHLQYRALSEARPAYPRKGNLWGWYDWLPKGLPYMARVDLWLGASPSAEQAKTLRQLNPQLRILTSINAVENGGLPDDYYLKDIHGTRVETWPGSYRLNLTKPYVADYQARFAYQTVLDAGLMVDGVFFDNVMTTQSWQNHDIYGNPMLLDANEDGVADDAATLDAAWKAGVFRELQTFRQLMPNAIVSGHAMDIYEPGIASLFNGISVGFSTADVLEKRLSFASLFTRYNDWLSQAVPPAATMIESSPMAQIGYGYDYSPWAKIPASTLEFARTYYPYVRFGLALTLLNDGYFAHEFGDTWHGNDWWYDELDFNLGYPLGPARLVAFAGPPATNLVSNGSFESPLAGTWNFWANTGFAATVQTETGNAAAGTNCARINVTQTTGSDWQIEFAQYNRSLVQGVSYDVTFRARGSAARSLTLSSQKGSADWRNYGLSQHVSITTNWLPYTVTFTANATVTDARLQFFLGATNGTVWLDDVRLQPSPPSVYRRDFNYGIVLLNAMNTTNEVALGTGFHRLTGSQAPLYETIIDDLDPAFSTTGTWTNAVYDSGLWQAAGPFYHSWAGSLQQRAGATGEARWQLPITAADTYTLSVWWPAAPAASNWTTSATFQIVANGVPVAATNLDQTTGGDQWHDLATVALNPTNAAYVSLTAASGTCVADAIHLQSLSRFNNGQLAASVRLLPMDGIILRRDVAVVSPPKFSQTTLATNVVSFTITELTPGFNWTLERTSDVATGVWQGIQSFQSAGFTTNLQDNLGASHSNAFYRIRAN